MDLSRGNEFDDINRLNGNVLPPNSIPKEAFSNHNHNHNNSGPIPPEQIARFLANRALNGEGSLFETQDSSNVGSNEEGSGRNNQSGDWNRTLKAPHPSQKNQNHSRPTFPHSNLPGSLPLDQTNGNGNDGVKAWRDRSSNPLMNGNGNLSNDGIRQRMR